MTAKRGVWAGVAVAAVLVAVAGVAYAIHQQPAGPDAQPAFLAAVREGQEAPIDDDAQVDQAAEVRGEEICDLLPRSLEVEDWTGTLLAVTPKSGEDRPVQVRLAEGVRITADIGIFASGLDPDNKVFDRLAGLPEGQTVRFAGAFLEGDDHCIDEASPVAEDGLRTPDFRFSFTRIEAY